MRAHDAGSNVCGQPRCGKPSTIVLLRCREVVSHAAVMSTSETGTPGFAARKRPKPEAQLSAGAMVWPGVWPVRLSRAGAGARIGCSDRVTLSRPHEQPGLHQRCPLMSEVQSGVIRGQNIRGCIRVYQRCRFGLGQTGGNFWAVLLGWCPPDQCFG